MESALLTAGKEVASKLRTQDPDGTIHTQVALGPATLTSLASQDSALASSAGATSEDSSEMLQMSLTLRRLLCLTCNACKRCPATGRAHR